MNKFHVNSHILRNTRKFVYAVLVLCLEYISLNLNVPKLNFLTYYIPLVKLKGKLHWKLTQKILVKVKRNPNYFNSLNTKVFLYFSVEFIENHISSFIKFHIHVCTNFCTFFLPQFLNRTFVSPHLRRLGLN